MTTPVYFDSADVVVGNPATLDSSVTLLNGAVVPLNGSSLPDTLEVGTGVLVQGSGFISDVEYYAGPAPGPFTLAIDGTIDADFIGQTLTLTPQTLTNEADGTLEARDGGDLVVATDTGTTPWVNSGAIVGIAGTLELTGAFSNSGTITTTGGTLELGERLYATASWSNTGTITTTDTAVDLEGQTTTDGVGTLDRTDGSLTLLGTIDNTASVLDTTTGTFEGLVFSDGTITGGTLITGPGGYLDAPQATLRGVTVDGGLTVATGSGSVGSITLSGVTLIETAAGTALAAITVGDGTLQLQGNSDIGSNPSATTLPSGDTTLVETSGIALGGGDLAPYQPFSPNATPVTLTIDAGSAVSGFGSIGSYEDDSNVVNAGHIDADAPGLQLQIDGLSFVNHGSLTAEDDAVLSLGYANYSPTPNTVMLAADGTVDVNAATLDLVENFANQGDITVTNGTLSLGSQGPQTLPIWTNSGTITADQTAIILGGNTTTATVETISRTGGTIALASGATIDNSGATIDTSSGVFQGLNIGGTVLGGTLVLSPSASFGGESGTLDGVTVDGVLVVGSSGNVTLTDGTTIADGIVGSGYVAFTGYSTIATDVSLGGGEAFFQATSGATTVIAASATLEGAGFINSSGPLDNQGTIAATSGGDLYVSLYASSAQNLSNEGILSASGGSTLDVATTIVAGTASGSIFIGTDGTVQLGSAVASDQTVSFSDATGTLVLGQTYSPTTYDTSTFQAPIDGFVQGDTIEINTLTATSATWVNGTLTLDDGSTQVGTLSLAGNYAGDVFSVAQRWLGESAQRG